MGLFSNVTTTKKQRGAMAPASPGSVEENRNGLDPQATTTAGVDLEDAVLGARPGGGQAAGPSSPGSETSGFAGGMQADNGVPEGTNVNAEAPATIDQMQEDYIREVLGSTADTSDQEAQMRAESDRTLGQGLVDMRARMGEAGFGMSGAAGALEGTLRSDAARQLSGDIMDLRDREEEQRRRAIEGAFGLDIAARDAARRQAIAEANAAAIQAILGGAPEDAAGAAGAAGGGGADTEAIPLLGGGTSGSPSATSQPSTPPRELASEAELPPDAQPASWVQEDGYVVYWAYSANGGIDYFKVPAQPGQGGSVAQIEG